MFWANFSSLCASRGESANAVAAKVGVKSTGTVSGWKDGALPRNSTLVKIANYFDVTVEELTQTKKIPANHDEDEDEYTKELRDIWNDSDQDERAALLEMARLIKKRRGK